MAWLHSSDSKWYRTVASSLGKKTSTQYNLQEYLYFTTMVLVDFLLRYVSHISDVQIYFILLQERMITLFTSYKLNHLK